MFKEITKDNWLLFAQHYYDKPIDVCWSYNSSTTEVRSFKISCINQTEIWKHTYFGVSDCDPLNELKADDKNITLLYELQINRD